MKVAYYRHIAVVMMKVSLVLIYCIAVSIRCTLAQELDCVYLYTEQPPDSLSCNPYEQRDLIMECTVHGPGNQDFVLAWFRQHSDALESPFVGDDSAILIENDNDAFIQSQIRVHGNETRKTIRSQLRLRLDSDASAGDVAFWCSVVTHSASDERGDNHSVTLPSDAFVLKAPEAYTNFPDCDSVPQSTHKDKCGLFSINKPHTPSSTPMPTTSSLTTDLETTSSLHISHTTHSTTATSWQLPSPSSQHPRPTNTILPSGHPTPTDNNNSNTEEDNKLNTIVYPLLACIIGVLGTLFIVSCIYLLCYYRRKKRNAVKKQIVEATYHTYSIPTTLSTCYNSKGTSLIGSKTSSSSPSPTLPPPRRTTRSMKSDNSSGYSREQYIHMSSGAHVPSTNDDNYSSCPTLTLSGHLPSLTSDCDSLKQGLSYEVPVPFQQEPDYDTISSTYVPYLIPVQTHKPPPSIILQQDRHHSLHSSNGIIPPPSIIDTLPLPQSGSNSALKSTSTGNHDYERLIHTRVNTAYREMTVQEEDKKMDTPQRTVN